MNSNQVLVSVENVAPNQGTALTPLWVGFHNGKFDTIDPGRPASEGVERIAEDGDAAFLNQEFVQSGLGSTQAVVAGPNGPITPGERGELLIDVTDPATAGRYLNYAAMLLPSNDFFVANDDPLEHEIFDERGRFIGADFIIKGEEVLDAGTEINDEIPANTAFFGQAVPDTGVEENGVIGRGEGFIPDGPVLSTPEFSNADFTQPNYSLARVRVFNAIVAEDSDDRLLGTRRDDYLSGNGGDDTLFGKGGDDRLLGGDGADFLFGQKGDDELIGEAGDDRLIGGRGDDILSGGAGNNFLRGGAGNDIFVLSSEGFADVRDFGEGDLLRLGSTLQFSELSITQNQRHTLIEVNGEQIARLRGVDASSITESLFI